MPTASLLIEGILLGVTCHRCFRAGRAGKSGLREHEWEWTSPRPGSAACGPGQTFRWGAPCAPPDYASPSLGSGCQIFSPNPV